MKKLFLFGSMLCGYVIAFSQHDMKNMPGMDTTEKVNKQSAQPVFYTCVMHPEIHSPKPGNCPRCGMKLVKEKVKAIIPPAKKGLDRPMLKDTAKHQHDMPNMQMDTMPKAVPQATTYTCVMHPEIHSPKPGNCSKCGMKLVKEKVKAVPQVKKEMDMPMPKETSTKSHQDNMQGMNMEAKPASNDFGYKIIESNQPPGTVRYDLYIKDTLVNFAGKNKRAIAVNGQIPMPTLTFTEGDSAEIYVHNELKEETSLHWHGLFLPNQYDGVPNLTQMPIKAGATHLYKFPIIQHGTHWYHSHTELQEQIGMYGAFIMKKRKETTIPTIPIVLSEWTNMNPNEVHRSLHNATDWFAIKKGTTQSYSEAIKSGHLKTKLMNEWKRMNPMDVSDVAYDKFFINGKSENFAQLLLLAHISCVVSLARLVLLRFKLLTWVALL